MNKKAKIGILTLSASDNCGSLLQAYALQKAIENMGYRSVEVIDFRSIHSKKMYSIIPRKFLLHPLRVFFTVLKYRALKNQKEDYENFRIRQLNLSEKKYENSSQMKELKEEYDVVICGSDQIWNVTMYDFDESFFLKDVEGVKKIAYAASLGKHSLREYKDFDMLKQWVLDFNHISVREKQGKKDLFEGLGKDVEVLADPTLLLQETEWYELAGNERLVKENYIFYYSWNYSNKILMEIVEKVAQRLNKKVYVINASKWREHSPKKYGFYLKEEGGPYTFLNLMRHADLVFIESLHGTIFSTIFKKNFWYLNDMTNGKVDTRNDYFLNLLNMSDRVISVDSNVDLDNIQKLIDYENNERLCEIVEKSKEWLIRAIES